MGLGQAEFLEGDLDGAERTLAEGLALARTVQPRYWITYALYWRGRVALARGDRETARTAFDEGVTLGLADGARLLGAAANLREEAGAAPLPAEREALDRLVTSVRDELGPVAFVAAFQGGQSLSLTQALELARPLLVVRALGALAISVDGTTLEPGAWRSVESRDLLLYLLCHPAGRTREQIGHALWPDASPAGIKNSLHVALDQLRRTLGRPDWIVFEDGRYRVQPQFRVEFDALQFEAEVRAARDQAALASALRRYHGDFLGGEPVGPWADEPRRRWRRLRANAAAEARRS